MANPERCPKCGSERVGIGDYKCGNDAYGNVFTKAFIDNNNCIQRQLDQQRQEMEKRFESVCFDDVEPIRGAVIALAEQLQALAERVKMLEGEPMETVEGSAMDKLKGGEHE